MGVALVGLLGDRVLCVVGLGGGGRMGGEPPPDGVAAALFLLLRPLVSCDLLAVDDRQLLKQCLRKTHVSPQRNAPNSASM